VVRVLPVQRLKLPAWDGIGVWRGVRMPGASRRAWRFVAGWLGVRPGKSLKSAVHRGMLSGAVTVFRNFFAQQAFEDVWPCRMLSALREGHSKNSVAGRGSG
jgi:hypothetical protein